ncbi:IgA FC receptor, partial [human gut metagenome]
LEKAIKDLMEQPEIPSNPEYGIQKSIWESLFDFHLASNS